MAVRVSPVDICRTGNAPATDPIERRWPYAGTWWESGTFRHAWHATGATLSRRALSRPIRTNRSVERVRLSPGERVRRRSGGEPGSRPAAESHAAKPTATQEQADALWTEHSELRRL